MRTWSRLITRRSNQVMYAMPVSKATMITSERMTSMSSSDTRDQNLLALHRGQIRVVRHDALANCFQIVGGHGDSQALPELGGNAPAGSAVHGLRRAAFLLLDSAFEVAHTGLALVGVRGGQHHVDARVVWHRP